MTSSSEQNARLKQGRKLLRSQEYSAAAEWFRTEIANDPDNANAQEGLGTACFLSGELDDAVEAFTVVTRLLPREARGYINLGAVFNRQGDYKQALATLRRALAKNPASPDAYYNMGLAHRGLRQHRLAVTAYREAIRLAPDMAEAHLNLANTYVEMNNHVQAVKEYEAALELRPDFERAARGLERVRKILDDKKGDASPFGRLVDSTVAPKAHDPSENRRPKLSEEDRIEQREAIKARAIEAEQTARVLAVKLNGDLEKAILSLNRAVLQGSGSTFVIQDALERFREIVADMETEWQELEQQTSAIRQLTVVGENS